MTAPSIESTTTTPAIPLKLLGIFLVGALVAVSLGAYGGIHDPTLEAPYKLFFTSTLSFKVWFCTFALICACVQILTALRLYGKIHVPKEMPPWFGDLHRLSGTLAFGFTLPVAYHCLWSLGFAATGSDGSASNRVLVHSILGCFFYGVFTIKVLGVRSRGLPGWVLPVVGGATFAVLIGIWVTSSVWYWREASFPGI